MIFPKLYPWPSGKEPWALVNGGDGVVPDAARNNCGRKPFNKAEVEMAAAVDQKRPPITRFGYLWSP